MLRSWPFVDIRHLPPNNEGTDVGAIMAKLTALQVKNASAGRHADGKGLYLLVKPSGSKSWVLRVQVEGIRRDFGLGATDLVTLQEAREKATEGRKLAKAGFDPAVEWRKGRERVPTFEEAAREYHANVKGGWRNGKHGDQWLATLDRHAFPVIGKLSVQAVDAGRIQNVLAPIWLTVPETARRVRQRVCAVLDYAHSRGWRPSEAPARAISKGLPRQVRTKGHFAAMPYAEVPAMVRTLTDDAPTAGRLALLFTVLTTARSGEVRGATWQEVDLENQVWHISAARMKAGEAHRVPLSNAAMQVLERAAALSRPRPDQPIFAGPSGKALSDMTLSKALKSAGASGCTVHGFRSSFRDWVAERTTYPGDWAEAALAHTVANRVEAAYRRTKFLDQRRGMMAAWADFLSGENNVVPLHSEQRA